MTAIDTSAEAVESDITPGMVDLLVDEARRSLWRSVNKRAILALAATEDTQ